MLLKDKNAVTYGAGGHIGRTVARAFAREGAHVFLAGRTLATLEALAEEIAVAGGAAEAAHVDALDPQAIEQHLEAIVQQAGRIDISFNAIWIRGDLQGTPLIQMPADNFTLPILRRCSRYWEHYLCTFQEELQHSVRYKQGVETGLKPARYALRVPLICMDHRLRQFTAAFHACFSKPQRRYFEIVLLALLLCQETHTLSGLLRQILARATLAGLSRFLGKAPWSTADVATTWRTRFDTQVAPLVHAEHARQRAVRPKRPGRPPASVVTGYLIGDDSTMEKVRGKQMAGLGKHHSTTAGTRVVGHSLVQGR